MAMTIYDNALLDAVFGEDSIGNTPEERAKTSSRSFVRSQVQLAFDNPEATGRKLTAIEAIDVFGWDILSELAEDDAVPFVVGADEPGRTIKLRREMMAISIEQFAKLTKVSADEIRALEEGNRRIPVQSAEKHAQQLSLDERQLGLQAGAGGDPDLAVRFRKLRDSDQSTETDPPPALMIGLSEAAWVIRRQIELQRLLLAENMKSLRQRSFSHSANYKPPVWNVGHDLAAKSRKLLDIPPNEPIKSLRDLVERDLLIPVVQSEFPSRFAGATIANWDTRGIVLNLKHLNTNVFTRRTTLAHELGHLLWDPVEKLDCLLVDNFSDLDADPFSNNSAYDPIEARANAFAVEFIAPRSAVRDLFNKAKSHQQAIVSVMMTYGISFTAAKWQIINTMNITVEDLKVEYDQDTMEPSYDWKAAEDFTADYFPIKDVPFSRRGMFAQTVINAQKLGFISVNTAAAYLGCAEGEFLAQKDAIESLL